MPFQNHVNILSPHADPYEMLAVNLSTMEKITVYSHLLSTDYWSTQEIFFLLCGLLIVLRASLGPCECLVKIQASSGPLLSTRLLVPSRNSSRLVRQDFSNPFLIAFHKISVSLLEFMLICLVLLAISLVCVSLDLLLNTLKKISISCQLRDDLNQKTQNCALYSAVQLLNPCVPLERLA